MTKKQKLLDKIRKNAKNVSLHDFEALMKDFGYIEEGGRHPKGIIGINTMPYKRENPVKSCYVKDLLEIIDSIKE
ncbi:MAG: hypothetical protein GX640_03065 [Fibrobacter sp.]|nr:hypothetical protein [Fibrobacter sp.]